MAIKHQIRAGYNGNSAEIEVRLPVILFKEGENFIAYIPVLDLSGYGKTEDEARFSLDVVLEDYIDYALKHHTLHDDLLKHGFRLNKSDSTMQPPEPVELFKTNSTLRQLVKDKDFNKTNKTVHIPAYS